MTEIISELTPEQEALIPVYREKWRKIALSTERIDRQKAAEAVKTVYTSFDLNEPENSRYWLRSHSQRVTSERIRCLG
jgi:hypothetical protein